MGWRCSLVLNSFCVYPMTKVVDLSEWMFWIIFTWPKKCLVKYKEKIVVCYFIPNNKWLLVFFGIWTWHQTYVQKNLNEQFMAILTNVFCFCFGHNCNDNLKQIHNYKYCDNFSCLVISYRLRIWLNIIYLGLVAITCDFLLLLTQFLTL
jgi:hypothetical protein